MSVIPELLAALKPLGFKRYEEQLGASTLLVEGVLATRFGDVPCMALIDRSFQTFPLVRLTPVPERLRPIAPHVGADGFLCYIADATAVVDIFDPIGQTLAAFEQAARVLDQIMAGERVDDLAEEFFAFWPGEPLYVDVSSRQTGEGKLLQIGKDCAISDDPERTLAKLKHRPGDLRELDVIVDRVTTKAVPRPTPDAWPPKTVRELLDWQGQLDDACRRKIEARIAKAYRKGAEFAIVVVDSPSMPYGFATFNLQKNPRGSSRDQRLPIYDLSIDRLRLVRIDDAYVVQRNIPGQATLAGKRIAIVGCGTIGGYLAEMLAKAGAGSQGGELMLVDNQRLEPGNLGRHRLGTDKSFLPKATSMADEIKRVMPASNVRAITHDAREVNLEGFDLLIDATGEQSLSQWLASYHSQITPLLHVWIEGAGIAVRSFIGIHASEGCYRCLCDYEKRGDFHAVEGGVEPLFAGQGCEGPYVPFSASVSMQAAALGFDAAMAWVGGKRWPGLSTRVLSRTHELATADCTILKRPGCPACGS
ncbi:ThiF family adenylyltransferase [Pseudomonas putida]|uniref:ThiF family adenylyltransferase n=1 Tax=Pseudomonas putida TaxID=303 RepID=A0AAW4BXJ7_PSEPU|nr:ThiF family adenylyltransferase [Pseudomonas putida]MBF8700291.1 ThiF family adenylyltransferase [Pseudomonas putida]MBF8735004.1 ThiF family adenylyltransferase [Pseudomonas putida]